MPSVDLLLEQGHAAEATGNYAHARACFEQGAALGDAICQTRLAYMFDNGIGVPVDKAKAMSLYRRAWRKRSTVAANNIAILYRERGNRRAMFKWFERCALEGDGDAQVEVAKCYLNRAGVRRDFQLALRWLVMAEHNQHITEASREEAQTLLLELRPRGLENNGY
jgi:TPR repeat protein